MKNGAIGNMSSDLQFHSVGLLMHGHQALVLVAATHKDGKFIIYENSKNGKAAENRWLIDRMLISCVKCLCCLFIVV